MKKPNVRTLALIICTFTYLLIGAAIFDALESNQEETIRASLENSELYYKRTYNITDEEYRNFSQIVNKYHAYRMFPQWQFNGAFYFSLTVITTIGYGHSTPQTHHGKAFCMLYAIIGIPLCLVMFQSVGERLNYLASLTLEFVKKSLKVKRPEVNQTEMVICAISMAFITIISGAIIFHHYENWDFFDSIYYCVITLTTIGFGDYVALQDRKTKSNSSYAIFLFTFILFGLAVVASTLNLLVLKFLTMNTDDEKREEYNRKVAERRSVELSQSNLPSLSVNGGINGHILCTFNQENLEVLKKENSLNLYQQMRNSMRSLLRKQFPGFNWKDDSNSAENGNKCINLTNKLPNEALNYEGQQQTTPKQKMCPECLSQVRLSSSSSMHKKPHYTIRRAPGKISHLISTSHSQDLIINFDKSTNKIVL